MDKNELITLSCKLFQAGVPTLNKRVYTADALEEACSTVKNPMFGCVGVDASTKTKMADVSHEVHDLRVNSSGFLVADIRVFDTDKGKILSTMFENDKELLTLNPCFYGVVNTNGNVDDITVATMNICLVPDELRGEVVEDIVEDIEEEEQNV